MCVYKIGVVAVIGFLVFACDDNNDERNGDGGDADTDADTDTDTDADADTDSDTENKINHQPMTQDCVGEDGAYDADSNLCWERRKTLGTDEEWGVALAHCDDLEFGGYSDWRLPSISELRTLIRRGEDEDNQDCYADEWSLDWTEAPEEYCGVHDGCLNIDECWSASLCYFSRCDTKDGPGWNGCYWGEIINSGYCSYYWSSSKANENESWIVHFGWGTVDSYEDNGGARTRCVRTGK